MRVEHYRRTDEGRTLGSLTQPDESLQLEAVVFDLALERIYFGVDLTNVRRLAR
jgi:hypothetical protein